MTDVLTLRDQFAIAALATLERVQTPETDYIAGRAYRIADAMLRERAKNAPVFGEAWAPFAASGYQYSADALENVRFGWRIAHGHKP